MALQIIASECTACGACEFECPNTAIKEDMAAGVFIIKADKCTECEGESDSPQCVVVCPADGCIVPLAA